jgi:2-keto-3-deoxy-L-rhamnonate aldolase RhmA
MRPRHRADGAGTGLPLSPDRSRARRRRDGHHGADGRDRGAGQADCILVPLPPGRVRGVAFGMPHDDYRGGDVVQKLREANERTLVIALIETAVGIANAEAIMAVDGIDIGWLGHFDLTNSMGIPGQFDHPDFLAAVDRLVAACRVHGKPAGVLAGSVEAAEAWRARGFRVFAYGTDISLLQESLRGGLARLRAGEGH